MEENYRNRFETEEEYNKWLDKYNGVIPGFTCCCDINGAFNEIYCKNEKGGRVEDRKKLSVYNVVKNEDGSEGLGSLVAEFDYTKEKEKEDTNKKIIITEEQTELYKEISQHLLEKGLINFTDNTPIKDYKVYKPENSPAPNWKKINFNKKRYKR